MNPNSIVAAASCEIPNNFIDSDSLLESLNADKRFGIANNWMSDRMGIVTRAQAVTGTQPGELAIASAAKCLSNSSIAATDIDIVIYCGIEKDQTEPATAHNVARELGIEPALCFDVMNACYGFSQGLHIADSLLSQNYETALVVTGETYSDLYSRLEQKVNQPNTSATQFKQMLGYFSLGDAGGAMLLTRSHNRSGIIGFHGRTQPKRANLCRYSYLGTGIEANMAMEKITIAGEALQRSMHSESIAQFGITKPDFVLFHQTGRLAHDRIVEMGLCKKPENVIAIYRELGNTTSATLPISYSKMLEKKPQQGDVVYCSFIGSGLACGQFAIRI